MLRGLIPSFVDSPSPLLLPLLPPLPTRFIPRCLFLTDSSSLIAFFDQRFLLRRAESGKITTFPYFSFHFFFFFSLFFFFFFFFTPIVVSCSGRAEREKNYWHFKSYTLSCSSGALIVLKCCIFTVIYRRANVLLLVTSLVNR